MARPFDRFMVDVELGSNPKLGRVNDREFRCLICGVWALAAKANPRGYLVVAGQRATERDVAYQARCSIATAKATLNRMREMGMLEWDGERSLEFCHDWTSINPEPTSDRTGADRQRRYRERHNNGEGNVTVTSPEVEGEVPATQVKTPTALRADVVECFAYWQERCGHPQAKLTADREAKIKARLREGYSTEEILRAVDGAARGAFVNDAGRRFDDIELICRSGSKLEGFVGRTGVTAGNVVALSSRERKVAERGRLIERNDDGIPA